MLSRFSRRDFTTVELVRYSAGAMVDGEWVPGAEQTPYPVVTVIKPQPAKPEEIEVAPEGELTPEHIVTWSDFEFNVRGGSVEADQIVFRGDKWKAWKKSNRSLDGNFYRILFRKVIE